MVHAAHCGVFWWKTMMTITGELAKVRKLSALAVNETETALMGYEKALFTS